MRKRTPLLALCILLAGPVFGSEPVMLSDPTRPDGSGAALVPAGPVLQSTMVSVGRKLAIISGRLVGVGDSVGRATVTDIRPYEVTLKQGGRETHLRLVPKLDTNVHPQQASHDLTDH